MQEAVFNENENDSESESDSASDRTVVRLDILGPVLWPVRIKVVCCFRSQS